MKFFSLMFYLSFILVTCKLCEDVQAGLDEEINSLREESKSRRSNKGGPDQKRRKRETHSFTSSLPPSLPISSAEESFPPQSFYYWSFPDLSSGSPTSLPFFMGNFPLWAQTPLSSQSFVPSPLSPTISSSSMPPPPPNFPPAHQPPERSLLELREPYPGATPASSRHDVAPVSFHSKAPSHGDAPSETQTQILENQAPSLPLQQAIGSSSHFEQRSVTTVPTSLPTPASIESQAPPQLNLPFTHHKRQDGTEKKCKKSSRSKTPHHKATLENIQTHPLEDLPPHPLLEDIEDEYQRRLLTHYINDRVSKANKMKTVERYDKYIKVLKTMPVEVFRPHHKTTVLGKVLDTVWANSSANSLRNGKTIRTQLYSVEVEACETIIHLITLPDVGSLAWKLLQNDPLSPHLFALNHILKSPHINAILSDFPLSPDLFEVVNDWDWIKYPPSQRILKSALAMAEGFLEDRKITQKESDARWAQWKEGFKRFYSETPPQDAKELSRLVLLPLLGMA